MEKGRRRFHHRALGNQAARATVRHVVERYVLVETERHEGRSARGELRRTRPAPEAVEIQCAPRKLVLDDVAEGRVCAIYGPHEPIDGERHWAAAPASAFNFPNY